MYYPFALAGHRGTCLRPLHIFALLCSGAGELQSLQSTLFTYGQQQQQQQVNFVVITYL